MRDFLIAMRQALTHRRWKRIQSEDEQVGKGRRWQTRSKKGKGRSQSADIFRISEHEILHGVEHGILEDDEFEDFYSSSHASASLSVQMPADSSIQQQQQQQQQPQAISPSATNPFAAPRPSASVEQATTYGDDDEGSHTWAGRPNVSDGGMGYDDNDEQATTQRQGSRIPSASHREGPVSVGAARRPSKVPILESETLGVPKKEMSGRASPLGEGRPKGSPSPPVPESWGGDLAGGKAHANRVTTIVLL